MKISPIYNRLVQFATSYFDMDSQDMSREFALDETGTVSAADLTDFFLAVESKFRVTISPDDLEHITNLGELADYIEDALEDL